MGFARKVGGFLLFSAIATAAVGYFNPGYLRRAARFFETEKTKIEKKAEDFDRPKIKKDEESTALSEMAGRYTCSLSNIRSQIIMTSTDIPVEISKDGNGRLKITFIDPIFRTNWSADLKQKGGNNFSFSHYAGRNTIIGSLGMKNAEKLTLHLDVNTVHHGRSSVNYTCRALKHKNTKKDKIDDTIRAVFIRPCYGSKDLYQDIITGKTRVSDGTVKGVCQDIKDSGVTDVFILFKSEAHDESAHYEHDCGEIGSLLYDSEYSAHESKKFQEARKHGFDPIGSIINECNQVYKKAKKQINFHAWVPIFRDPKIIEKLGGSEKVGQEAKALGFLWSAARSKEFADPNNQEVVSYERGILDEITQKYPYLIGINLDYIRYTDETVAGAWIAGFDAWNVDKNAIENFVRGVKEKFSKYKLSADVKAGEEARKGVGQDGILPYLDMIIPMEYRNFGISPEQIGPLAGTIKSAYKDKIVLPVLKGWLIVNIDDQITLKNGLKQDILAVRSNAVNGYSIFTYETLIIDSGVDKLSLIKKELGY